LILASRIPAKKPVAPESATYEAIFDLSLLWANTAEGGDLPELFAEDFAGWLVEEAFAVHHAGNAVIDRIARIHRDLDSGFTHTGQETSRPRISNLRSHY